MRDSIPGRWDHDLRRRQMLNQLCHPGAHMYRFLIRVLFIYALGLVLGMHEVHREACVGAQPGEGAEDKEQGDVDS